MRRHAILLTLATLALAACQNEQGAALATGDSAEAYRRLSSSAKDSVIRMKDSLLNDRARQLSVQSTLIGDAVTSARLVAEIDRELSKVRGLKAKGAARTEAGEPSAAEQLVGVQEKVNQLITRLNQNERRVRALRQDSTAMAAMSADQVTKLAEYEKSIGELRTTVDQQATEILALRTQVDTLTRSNVQLTARTVAMAARDDSVFVAIGSEDELRSQGVVKKEGGSKILFGAGRTLVPQRDLKPGGPFTLMSRARDLTIPMPKADKSYRIVTRHSLRYADPSTYDKDGNIRGQLKITDAEGFWAASKYLILVER
jgi:flagellar biosynthesis chaperone FliJ